MDSTFNTFQLSNTMFQSCPTQFSGPVNCKPQLLIATNSFPSLHALKQQHGVVSAAWKTIHLSQAQSCWRKQRRRTQPEVCCRQPEGCQTTSLIGFFTLSARCSPLHHLWACPSAGLLTALPAALYKRLLNGWP
jgi:hypothetical protein